MTTPVLLKLESFGHLHADDKALVEQLIASERDFDGRTDIIREGDTPSDVHLVTAGFACRYKLLSNGKRQIVALLLPGDFCDLNAFIVRQMDHGIATLAPSKIARASREAILKMLESPRLAKTMFMAALVDSATLRAWVANLGSRNAEDRIAHLMCEIYARLEAVNLATDDQFSLPMSQKELAETVGLSLVHTNKSLASLRKKGLLSFSSGQIDILNARLLKEACGFLPNYLHLDEARGELLLFDEAISG